MDYHKKRHYYILIALLFSIVALVYIFFITTDYELAVSPDSVHYHNLAQNISQGNGLLLTSEEATYWPPLYPIFLSVTSWIFSCSILSGARILAALLFALNVLLSNLIFLKFSRSKVFIVVFNIIIITSKAFQVHVFLWSEPLAIFFLLLSTFVFIRFIHNRKYFLLAISGIIIGLMILTRYAGLGFLSGYVLYLFIENQSWKKRFLSLIILSSAALLIISPWFIFTSIHSVDPLNKEIAFHPITLYNIKLFFHNIFSWINPSLHYYYNIALFILLFLIIIKDIGIKGFTQIWKIPMASLLIILTLSYVGFLVFTITFIDAYIVFDNRILSLIFPFVGILVLVLIIEYFRINKRRDLPKLILINLLIFCCFSYILNFYTLGSEFKREGMGFTNQEWMDSKIITELKKPYYSDKTIYSNGNDLISITIGKNEKNYSLPKIYDPTSCIKNVLFSEEMKSLKDSMLLKNTLIIYFDSINWRDYLPAKNYIKIEFKEYEIDSIEGGMIIIGIDKKLK